MDKIDLVEIESSLDELVKKIDHTSSKKYLILSSRNYNTVIDGRQISAIENKGDNLDIILVNGTDFSYYNLFDSSQFPDLLNWFVNGNGLFTVTLYEESDSE